MDPKSLSLVFHCQELRPDTMNAKIIEETEEIAKREKLEKTSSMTGKESSKCLNLR